MFVYVSGKLNFKSPTFIAIDVHGVGFKIFTPLSTYYKLPDVGQHAKLLIYTYLREDSLSLYGFLTKEERDAFEILISVSGVGPRVAMSILSELSVGELKSAVIKEDLRILTSIPGVGKKTAQRIILEISEKIEDISAQEPGVEGRKQIVNDAVSALISLGYSRSTSKESVDRAAESLKREFSIEDIIKQALKFLR